MRIYGLLNFSSTSRQLRHEAPLLHLLDPYLSQGERSWSLEQKQYIALVLKMLEKLAHQDKCFSISLETLARKRLHIATDAACSRTMIGLGIVLFEPHKITIWGWIRRRTEAPELLKNAKIYELELLVATLPFRLFTNTLNNSNVILHCDNVASGKALRQGAPVTYLARLIVYAHLCFMQDLFIQIYVIYVNTKRNIGDLPSRVADFLQDPLLQEFPLPKQQLKSKALLDISFLTQIEPEVQSIFNSLPKYVGSPYLSAVRTRESTYSRAFQRARKLLENLGISPPDQLQNACGDAEHLPVRSLVGCKHHNDKKWPLEELHQVVPAEKRPTRKTTLQATHPVAVCGGHQGPPLAEGPHKHGKRPSSPAWSTTERRVPNDHGTKKSTPLLRGRGSQEGPALPGRCSTESQHLKRRCTTRTLPHGRAPKHQLQQPGAKQPAK